jgi:nitrite reductase (NADH) small subunit
MRFVWKNIGAIGNIPLRGARRLDVTVDEKPIAVFRTSDDEVFALVDECPHRKGPLSEGIVSGDVVTCPLHNWLICLRNGEAHAPDEGRTRSLPVRIENGQVHIGFALAVEHAA